MISRTHKDTVFRDLFGARERRDNALSLYNALNGSSYDDPAVLELTTIDDVLYMGVKNDISFLVGDAMVLWVHQSTLNPNMPLRGLWYFARLYTAYADSHRLNIYGSRRLALPRPRYVVLYSGDAEAPDESELRLSDSFIGDGRADVEVVARMVNVNAGHSPALMAGCGTLADYAQLLELIRENRAADMEPEEAIDAAVLRCVDEGVLAAYLSERRAQVVDMFMTEYDEAKTMAMFREEGRAEGRASERAGTLLAVAGMVREGVVSAADAARRFGFTEAELASGRLA